MTEFTQCFLIFSTSIAITAIAIVAIVYGRSFITKVNKEENSMNAEISVGKDDINIEKK